MLQKDMLVYLKMNDVLQTRAFACYNKNIDVRLDSTSGGVFTIIAEYIISRKHGIVFGATFDDDFRVIHVAVEDVESLKNLRGSKYPQSCIGDCYIEIGDLLKNNRTVLFVGTPCQIVGLKNYLGKDYSNLYCIDFVCHGVASPLIWTGYLDRFRRKGAIHRIVFKHKYRGWKKWYFWVEYGNKTFRRRGGMTEYMRSYLGYANIRPSCFECKFKGLRHSSDFTISDCWGLGENNKELNDNKGLSALLVHTTKGNELFESVRNELVYQEYDPQLLMEGNWTAFRSVKPNGIRTPFFECFATQGAEIALKKYFKPSILSWLHYFYLRVIGKEK